MKVVPHLSLASIVALLFAVGVAIVPPVARPAVEGAPVQSAPPPGESVTRLSDGRVLRLGGESGAGVVTTATIVDPTTGRATTLPVQGRAWHTATVLPDGRILIAGGVGVGGQPVGMVEVFDPDTNTFVALSSAQGVERSRHTATLLTDGRVLVAGGIGPDGESRADAELWMITSSSVSASSVNGRLLPGEEREATLLPNGRVKIISTTASGERAVAEFDPAAGTLIPTSGGETAGGSATLAEALPSDGASDVPEGVRPVLRFSMPLHVDSLSRETVTLRGATGPVDVTVVPAEGGRLLFVTPRLPLAFGASYELRIAGAVDERGTPVTMPVLRFTTRADPDSRPPDAEDYESWRPNPGAGKGGWRTDRPDSPWAMLPPLMAPEGVTALSGQALRLDGRPLRNVTLEIDGHTARTDQTGRFLLILDGVAPGWRELEIDGRTASQGNRKYGFFEYGLTIKTGQTTVLPFTIWMPRLDTVHTVAIASPTVTETVVTTPYIPGLELHLPAGTTIRDHDGQVVRELSITAIPVDRPPFPLPKNVDVPVYFTIQPGGAYVHTSGPGPRGAWLVYPNYRRERADKRIQFFHYDPEALGWYVYGLGTVTANRAQVVPDPTTRLYEFTGAMINSGSAPPPDGPPPGDCCGNDGDPVNLATGLFTLEQTDVSLPDVLPIAITRSYRTRDLDTRPFGIGWTHSYAMFLWSAHQYTEADLILPDGARIHYVRTSPGAGWVDAVFEHVETATTTATPTAFYKSVIRWNGLGWDLRLKDGTVYVFGENAPLQAIRDRYGNTVTVQRVNGQQHGNITRVVSPHGRWFEFTYDGSDRITQIKDNIGRTWGYTYDAAGNLWKVTDPMTYVTEYTYDTAHRMKTVKNRNGIVYVTNEYTAAADAPTPVGWVKKQTHADGGVYEFTYTVVNGKSTQTDVKDPRGYMRRVIFNPDGYTVADKRALETVDEYSASSTRFTGSNFPASRTDNLERQVTYERDDLGNETSTTWLAGTASAVTATYTYDPVVKLMKTVTDPLLHTTTVDYDGAGNVVGIIDALNHRTTIGYNESGQVTSVADPLQYSTTFTYSGADVRTVTDPLSRIRTLFTDAVGRVVSVQSPSGAQTRYEYDALDRVTKIVDPVGGETRFAYFPDGHLQQMTDARNNTMSFGYTSMGQVETQTDGLGRVARYEYDKMGSVIKTIDRGGQITTFEHDPLGRVKVVTYADLSTTAYTYDTGGRVFEIIDSLSGTIRKYYDDLDRLTSETTPVGTVSYAYDAADRLTSMTVAGLPTVTYGYDDANRITSVTRGPLTATMTYDDASRRATLVLPNGITTTYTYDEASQMTAVSHSRDGVTLGSVSYGYDLNGNRTSIEGLGVLLPQAVASAVYDDANQLISWGSRHFTYDANGNRASSGLTSYGWNARNQLAAVTGESTASFAYDASGRRRGRTVAGVETSFLYDGTNIVGEYSGGSLTASIVANRGADEYFARLVGSTVQIPLVDALGTVTAVTDTVGAINARLEYEPFGRSASITETDYPYGFTSREADIDGLLYYRARYYDPAVGRFISEDPLGLSAGVNVYAYAMNSPLMYTDPTGTSAQGARTILEAVLGWLSGTLATTVYGPTHPVTNDIRRTPAMDEIRKKYVGANCATNMYCGDYQYRQVLTTTNIVGQVIGAFCARMTNAGGGNVNVRAQNTWGLESATRLPGTGNRTNATVSQMLSGRGPLEYPRSLLENRTTPGMMQNVTLYFLWTEYLPCQCQ